MASLEDVWIVSMDRLLSWMEDPKSTAELNKLPAFRCDPSFPVSNCLDTVNCEYKKFLNTDSIFMRICGKRCPKFYPWLHNVDGDQDVKP